MCIADKSLGRNGQQIGMLMYPDDLCSAVIDNYGYYCLCVCLTVCWCFHFAFFLLFFSKVMVGAKEGGSHYWEMAVAITCGYGGYLLPLLAAHSSYPYLALFRVLQTLPYLRNLYYPSDIIACRLCIVK